MQPISAIRSLLSKVYCCIILCPALCYATESRVVCVDLERRSGFDAFLSAFEVSEEERKFSSLLYLNAIFF